MSNHYAFLGLRESATVEEIKKAYRKLALKHHPDKSKAPDSVDNFKKLVEAYDILSDPKKKQEYDRNLVSLTTVNASFRSGQPPKASAYYSYPQSGVPNAGYSNYFASARPRPSHFKQTPPHNNAQRPNTATENIDTGRTHQFHYHDEDEFDFLYKKNQTSYDSFSNSKTYFTSNIRSQQSNQRGGPTNGKFGSHFHRANPNMDGGGHPNSGVRAASAAAPGATPSGVPHYNHSSNFSGKTYAEFQNGNSKKPSSYTATDENHVDSENHRRSSVPPYQAPPSNNSKASTAHHPYQSQPASASQTYTQGSTTMPSIPTDPLPKSWQKQQTNFKKPQSHQPSQDASNNSSDYDTNGRSPPDPLLSAENNNSRIRIPPNAKNTGSAQRPKTPPSINKPLHPTARGPPVDPQVKASSTNSDIPGLKFDMSGFKSDLKKSSPQNIRTQNRTLNKNGRRGIPIYNSGSPSANNTRPMRSKFSTSSGRPSRTTLEESRDVEYDIVHEIKDEITDTDNEERNAGKEYDDNNGRDEEADDEIIEIDESTFNNKSATFRNTQKKSKPNPKTSLDFEGFSTTTPLTQTNGNFNMNDISNVLQESSDDVLNGKRTKKQRTANHKVFTDETLFVYHDIKELKLPSEPDIVDPKNSREYDLFKTQFEDFQFSALELKSQLTEYLRTRLQRDKELFKHVFRSVDNMEFYEQALNLDIYAQTLLWETNQAVIRVMRNYRRIKENSGDF